MAYQICTGVLVLLWMSAAAFGADVFSWDRLLDSAKGQGELQPHCRALVAAAREAAAKPIIKRAKKLADVGQNRTWLDGRANALEPEIKESFAQAMSDFSACNTLAEELPLLAAAFRLTGENVFRDRAIAQLEEMASWSPLQRPGWTLYHPGARLPQDGKDGNWLATGCGVRALADTIETLPAGTIEPGLRTRIDALLEREIAGVVDDWQTKRPWFVSGNNAVTNQWVLPTEGLVRACLVLGADGHADAYALGVKNLLQALDAHGPHGEFEEGFGYATFTVTALASTARAMAVCGDRRAVDHPFLQRFPTWLVHHFQPGDMTVNCFDAGPAHGGPERSRSLLSLLAVCTGSEVARWALAYQTDGPANTVAGLAVRAMPPVPPEAAPPLYAAYERAARVNWRDSWGAKGSGVWVRGGHPLDQHDHCDRGHVNYISRGRPILIEAGTPPYHHPLMGSHFASGAGHNVLQIGTEEPRAVNAGETLARPGWQKMGVVAPITVHTLDATKGDVTVTITSGYDGLKQWSRHVQWVADIVEVQDAVELEPDRADVLLFRWHTGTNDTVSIRGAADEWTVAWPDAHVTLKGSHPIQVTQVKQPDNTVNEATGDPAQEQMHTCIVVRTAEPVHGLQLTTKVRAWTADE